MNVIPFRSSGRIVIECGVTTGVEPPHPPRMTYWLDWIDETGDLTSMVWDGLSHSEAMVAAAEWRLPIVDNTRGRR